MHSKGVYQTGGEKLITTRQTNYPFDAKFTVLFNNCVPKRHSELQTWRNTQINEWINGTPSVTAFDECLRWFIEINGDHIRSEEAGADYDSMKIEPA